jgi:hypothetical protein
LAPAVQLILLRFAETVYAETDCGACGFVVIEIAEEAVDAAEVPAAFVAVTVNVTDALTGMPLTVSGDDAPDAVWPELAVTVNEVAAGESAGKENETTAAPLLYALSVPTFEADTPVGANGSKKSFEACDFFPTLLPI